MIMKAFLSVMVGLSLFFCSCNKADPVRVLYRGVVIYDVCSNVVVQCQGQEKEKIGQDGWVDNNDPNKPVYDHVFSASNPCSFGSRNFGDTIDFYITTPEVQRCAQCDVKLAMPSVSYAIHVVN
jgi:hypothetical protein